MRSIKKNRGLAETVISTAFIVLFMYTGINKIRDYEIFRVRLDQSPLLEGMGDWVAVGIPAALIATSFLLLFQRTRLWGMYTAFGLMVMFTTYIAIVLSFFSSSLPCSCNGVSEAFSWNQHLWFNVFFTVLAGVGIYLHNRRLKDPKDKYDLIYDTTT